MNFSAGDDLDAALLSSLSQVAFKSADEIVNNSATFQNDDHLFVPLVANAVYMFRLTFVHNSGATPDLKTQFTVPAGTTMAYCAQAGSATAAASGLTQANTIIWDGTGGEVTGNVWGYITTGGTAGNLQLQWAQNTANASDTTLRKGSILEVTRVS